MSRNYERNQLGPTGDDIDTGCGPLESTNKTQATSSITDPKRSFITLAPRIDYLTNQADLQVPANCEASQYATASLQEQQNAQNQGDRDSTASERQNTVQDRTFVRAAQAADPDVASHDGTISEVESTDQCVGAALVATCNTTSSSDQPSSDDSASTGAMTKREYDKLVKCNNADGTKSSKRHKSVTEWLEMRRQSEDVLDVYGTALQQLRFLFERRFAQLVTDVKEEVPGVYDLCHVIPIGSGVASYSEHFVWPPCESSPTATSLSTQGYAPDPHYESYTPEVTIQSTPTPVDGSASQSTELTTPRKRNPPREYKRKTAKLRHPGKRRGVLHYDSDGEAGNNQEVKEQCILPCNKMQNRAVATVSSIRETSLSDAEQENQYGQYSSLAICLDFSVVALFSRCAQNGKHPHMCLPGQEYTFKRSSRQENPVRGAPAPVDRIQIDSPEFDQMTQLLHASSYNQIIQGLGTISTGLPQDTRILSHFIAGVANFKLSKYEVAKGHFQECESIARQGLRDGDVMLCNAYLGDIEYTSKSYLKAAERYKVAISRYSSESVASVFKLTPPTLSAIHAKRASCFRNESRMVEAVNEYKIAIRVAQIDRDRLSSHTSLGNLYQSMGDNTNALSEYKESIALAEKLSDHVSLGWAHGNIGNAYLGLSRKDEALYHLHKSLDLAVEYERTPQAIGRTYNNLGTAYQSLNNLDKAMEYYDLALSQAITGDDKAGQARVHGNIANVYMLRKNYERAIPQYGEVLILHMDLATVSTAQHNRGCAYYEWATSLHPLTPRKLYVHGPHCNTDSCLGDIPHEAHDLYSKGSSDLKEVVKYHEHRFQYIKGSSQGLTLSVSLFESNSRTFHRLQDCLVNLHRWDEALVVAEQSRARTLGELMLKKETNHCKELTSPLSFDEIVSIVKKQKCPLVYLSYTGARLIGWVFVLNAGEPTMNSFEVRLSDDQFEGKSFDYYLRYTLTEKLVERSFEMYKSISYDKDSSSPVQMLHQLVASPIEGILDKHHMIAENSEIICISDSYTTLLPLGCLLDAESGSFFGDKYVFRLAPSLLSLGILDLISEPRIILQNDEQEICVIGDPSIPPFTLNGEVWNLGRLPYAKREAEWVAHVLQTTPILKENATKVTLLNRAMRAKLIHIATHGSASAGFLAFGTYAYTFARKSQYGNYIGADNVLLYPEEVEKLNISPALVVLSSCDSGRGTVKADGIQGMARAFILAGAQSVLTTLWKVPDESASVFMQFFYEYLLGGLRSSFALQKAILSVRCFAKYSQYIHWSGYQLTGRDIQISKEETDIARRIRKSIGQNSAFPHVDIVKKLKKALLNDPVLPTDVQIVKGPPGVNPSEVVIDFVTSFHEEFPAGIFWINSHQIEAGIKYIEQVIGCEILELHTHESHQALLVLDGLSSLPPSESFLRVMKSHHIHIIAINDNCTDNQKKLIKEVDLKLVRGCSEHEVPPLSVIHSQQRIVHSIMTKEYFTPSNDDQHLFERLAEFTMGSPILIEIVTQVAHELTSNPVQWLSELVMTHVNGVVLEDSDYDSWKSLLQACNLEPEEEMLLNCLAIFNGCPIFFPMVVKLASLITAQNPHLAGSLHCNLEKYRLLRDYPLPVVYSSAATNSAIDFRWVYVPKYICQCIWATLEEVDQVVAFALVVRALRNLCETGTVDNSLEPYFLNEAYSCLQEKADSNYSLIGKECYKELCSIKFCLK